MRRHNFNGRASRRHEQPNFGTGTLRNGEAYEIRQLDQTHLDTIVGFHQRIHDTLKEEERTFINHKTREEFAAYLNGKGVILGVITAGGQLVAMGNLLLPTKQYPGTGTADMQLHMQPETVGVLQSDSVLPEYRGQNLQEKLAVARIRVAQSRGRKHILALADTKNLATIKSLMNAGLAIVGMGTDPEDGGKIFHMHGYIGKDARKFRLKFGR